MFVMLLLLLLLLLFGKTMMKGVTSRGKNWHSKTQMMTNR
jgi:hypothetical protein